SLFNNSLLSDVTILQTYNGVTKEYFAPKAVLCVASGWFVKALTGNFKVLVKRILYSVNAS
ncbi:hypothetical protein DE146DRAFT_624931, partial [Phaeosphaeria sp. MPI-PUGE-AT-0046c]